MVFRSGVTERATKKGVVFSQNIQDIAIQAVQSAGVYFGGVDLLSDKDDEPHIAEVNFPCAFTSTERIASVDISGPLVDFLSERVQQLA